MYYYWVVSELDIIIPVYNEGAGIPATLRALAREVSASARVLICYDFDEDDTLPAIERHRANYPNLDIIFVKNSGRGAHAAVMSGFAASSAPYVMMYPADDDYNAPILDVMLAEARRGADVVCASRFMAGGSMVGCPFLKALLVRVGNGVLYYLAGVPTHDATNGFRLFSRRVIREILVESTTGFTYSIELLVKAHRRGMQIREVPAQWFERAAGKSRFQLVRWLPAYMRWCGYAFASTVWHRNRSLTSLFLSVLVLSIVPWLLVWSVLGTPTPPFPPTFADETFYIAHVQNIAEGHLNDGNPYFLEHATAPPLVIFGGAWLHAVPFMLGLPYELATYLNFLFWSLLHAGAAYWLFRELSLGTRAAALGALLQYVLSYMYLFRPANLQPVFPVFLLFCVALVRLLRAPGRVNMFLLAAAYAASFYLYSYLWQIFTVVLGLMLLYALWRKHWPLFRYGLGASVVGGLLGLPVPLYMLYLANASPYFWESIARFGLVETHVPMAEILYSGGWVGVVLMLLFVLRRRVPAFYRDPAFRRVALFVALMGLGLWILQGSNLLTGKLLETGEHVRTFIAAWLVFSVIGLGALLWRSRTELGSSARTLAGIALAVLACAAVYLNYKNIDPFVRYQARAEFWKEEQTYAGPFSWLQQNEPEPVVVWSDPHDYMTTNLPIFTRHYALFAVFGMWHLVSQEELNERYLVSQYFDAPTAESLRAEMENFMGRNYLHLPPTSKREFALCELFRLGDAAACTPPKKLEEFLEPGYFVGLEKKFSQTIKPNIHRYLKKYDVRYIIVGPANKDWHPELLGGKPVYRNERYTLYRLPS